MVVRVTGGIRVGKGVFSLKSKTQAEIARSEAMVSLKSS